MQRLVVALFVALDVVLDVAARCSGGDRCHSGGFLLRIMPPSWRPVPACAPRPCCRRAVLRCRNNCFRRAVLRCRYECCRPNCSTLRRRKLESDAVRYCGRDRRPTTMLQVGRFTLRRRKLASDAAPLRLRLLQAELFYFAGTMALHRFSISGPDLRIAAAAGPFLGEIVH